MSENDLRDPEPATETDAYNVLVDLTGILAVVCGGFLAFAHLAAPTRLSGATRSAKLKWQQRQTEVQQAVKDLERCQSGVDSATKQPSP
jgi:hypothetical protein